jgi:ribonuclease HI
MSTPDEIMALFRTEEEVLAARKPSVRDLIIYVDGSCTGNGTPTSKGGWGFLVIENSVVIHEAYNPTPMVGETNNTMELTAVLAALKWVDTLDTRVEGLTYKLEFRSDSQVVIGWLSQGWKCKHPHLEIILKETKPYVAKHGASFTKVKGHSGEKYNEMVDRLAVKGSSGT